MNEAVFFNPGDAVASSHDFKEARRSAQIIKAERPTGRQIVIAENDKNGVYAVYYADSANKDQSGSAHHIKDQI